MIAGRASFAGVLLLAVAASTSVLGQGTSDNDPDGAQGYVDNVFHQNSIDSINLYNGQLTIPIAVGPSYPVGPKLRFQTFLTYNSNVIDYPRTVRPLVTAYLLPGNPALGLGWTFTLGTIKPTNDPTGAVSTYFGPDGSQHPFYSVGSGWFKTKDASQLYLHEMRDGQGILTGYEMWDGDGNRHVFSRQVSGFNDVPSDYHRDFGLSRDGWYLTSMADAFGNAVTVDYQAGATPCWTAPSSGYTCSSGDLQTTFMNCPGGAAWLPWKIHLPTGDINIGTSSDGRLTSFDFPVAYGQRAVWYVDYLTPAPTVTYSECSPTLTQTLYYISAIRLPNTIGGSPRYDFTYDTTCTGNLLKTIKIPTGATISYDWGTYNFYHPRAGEDPACNPGGRPATAVIRRSSALTCSQQHGGGGSVPSFGGPPDPCPHGSYYDDVTGVVRRTERTVGANCTDPGANCNVTDYLQYSFPWGIETQWSANCDVTGACPAQTLTIVTFPSDVDGKRRAKSVLFWSGPKQGSGLSTPGSRVSAEIRECDYDGDPSYFGTFANGDSTVQVCGGSYEYPFCPKNAVRVTQRTFEYDDMSNEVDNRRLLTEKRYYGPASNTCQASSLCSLPNGSCASCPLQTTANANLSGYTWEGSGRHYTTETRSDNSGVIQTTNTYWTPPAAAPTVATPWLPNIYTRSLRTRGSSTVDRYLDFGTRGVLIGNLLYDAARQLIFATCRYPDASGNVLNEMSGIFFGWASPPPYNGCSLYFPAFPSPISGNVTGKVHTYQNGRLLTSKWWNVGAPASWTVKSFTRDPSTGWVTSSSDSAGRTTSYAYDVIGRVNSVTPPDEAPITVAYPAATQTIATRNGGTGPLGTSTEYDYDALGRLQREIRLMPGGVSAKRFTLYDHRGYDYFKSEWVSNGTSEALSLGVATTCAFSSGSYATLRPAAAPGTFQSCFDPFGRPQSIVGAGHTSWQTVNRSDGSAPYSDSLESVTTSCINGILSGSGCTGGTDVTSLYRKDAFGHRIVVTEPTSDVTSYTYDANDNLTGVAQGSQMRSFVFDPAGNLRQEITPEKGTVTYDYGEDAANPHVSCKCAVRYEPDVTVTTTSDFANRVQTMATSEGRTYVTNTYDEASHGSSGGKLTSSLSTNYALLAPSTVTDSFTYSGVGGRLSTKIQTLGGSANLATTQAFGYNSLGLLSSHAHPRAGADPAFTVSSTFDAGLQISQLVNGTTFVSGITYQPSGAVASYTTNNGPGHAVTTTISPDGSLPRPAHIQTTGASSNFDSGVYAYDGAGNIRTVGADTFTYDSLSRLATANIRDDGGTNHPETFTPDRYGNILSRTVDGSTITFSINSATNQFVTGPQTKYDLRGNLTLYGVSIYTYDGLSRQASYQVSGTVDERYLYDAARERVARVTPGTLTTTGGLFYTVNPCRLFDSRVSTPAISAGGQRTVLAWNVCGIPTTATTLAANVTSVNVPSNSFFRAYAAGLTPPPLAWVNAFRLGQATATQALISINGPTPGSLTLYGDYPSGTADGVIDVDGYFTQQTTTTPDTYNLTFRDPQNRLATRYTLASGVATVAKDYVYVGNQLVATWSPANGYSFFMTDHLGTPRLQTDVNGTMVTKAKNRAFGLPLTGSLPQAGPEYASMEKDASSSNHYDHARFYASWQARFQSPDMAGGKPDDPQSWNRYAYARNNPLKHVDSDGHAVKLSTEASQELMDYQNQKRAFENLVNLQALRENWSNGRYWMEVATAATNAILGDPASAMMPSPMALEVPGEASLLKFTSGNFRQNLMRFLGKSAEEVAGKDAHHMLPQAEQLAKQFSAAGLSVHDPKWGAFLEHGEHLARAAEFNADWTAYLSKEHTAGEIDKYARVLAAKYDIRW